MTDFETLVRSMMKNGATAEDIAKMTTDTLNTINNEKEKTDNRKETLDRFKEVFKESYAKNDLNPTDAAALCVLVCADSYPNWGPAELEEFFEIMENNIRSAASLVGKTPTQAIKEILGSFSDAITDSLKEAKTSCSNKREDKVDSCHCKKLAAPTGNTRPRITKTTYKTPEEMLIEFINSL